MTRRRSTEPKKQDAKDSFEAVAKRLECDEDKLAFEAKLGKIATAKISNGKPSKENKAAWSKQDKPPKR